jgi:hypothetical protein
MAEKEREHRRYESPLAKLGGLSEAEIQVLINEKTAEIVKDFKDDLKTHTGQIEKKLATQDRAIETIRSTAEDTNKGVRLLLENHDRWHKEDELKDARVDSKLTGLENQMKSLRALVWICIQIGRAIGFIVSNPWMMRAIALLLLAILARTFHWEWLSNLLKHVFETIAAG